MRTITLNRIAVLTAVVLSATLHAQSVPPVTMIGETTLTPGSTLEFRFSQAMVAPDQLGAAATSPVKFTPELQGAFTKGVKKGSKRGQSAHCVRRLIDFICGISEKGWHAEKSALGI